MSFTRRQVLKTGAVAGLGAYLNSIFQSTANANNTQNPHFFLMICFSGGIDPLYLFDARKLELTDAGLVHNYLYKNASPGTDEDNQPLADATPIPYVGKNGGKTLRTALTEPLMAHKDDFTIINGVFMSPDGDGHGQSMYYLFGGKSVKADSFVPRIGEPHDFPLTSIHLGGFAGDGNQTPTNFATSAHFNPSKSGSFKTILSKRNGINLAEPDMDFVLSRFNSHQGKMGMFSEGAVNTSASFERTPKLESTLKNMDFVGGIGVKVGQLVSAVDFARSNFAGGVTNSFTIMMNTDGDADFQLDTHSSSSAQTQPKKYKAIAKDMAAVFEYLKNTPFDEGRSFFDVTTVVITSEFARTYRQSFSSIDATGTDHNPLNNTVIVAGKGIEGGLVLGESDLTDLNEEKTSFANVSPAHLKKDSALLKPMGKPFDFETSKVRNELPETFAADDYISFASIANTLMTLFGVKEDKFFRMADGKSAPIVKFTKQP